MKMRMSSRLQVYHYYSFEDKFFEDIIHYHLESGQAISKTEKHDERFKEASVHLKSGLPLIAFLDANIIESPLNVQLGEVLRPSEFCNKLWNERKWVLIFHSHGIQRAVILYQVKSGILFLNEEDRCSHQGLRETDLTGLEVFLKEGVKLGLFGD